MQILNKNGPRFDISHYIYKCNTNKEWHSYHYCTTDNFSHFCIKHQSSTFKNFATCICNDAISVIIYLKLVFMLRSNFSLVYFFWEKNKVITTLRNLSTAKNPITEVSFHPKDRSVVCVIGHGVFKMCRLTEGASNASIPITLLL